MPFGRIAASTSTFASSMRMYREIVVIDDVRRRMGKSTRPKPYVLFAFQKIGLEIPRAASMTAVPDAAAAVCQSSNSITVRSPRRSASSARSARCGGTVREKSEYLPSSPS